MHRVVRPFPVSWDGLTLVDLIAGDERDFGEMTAGLLAEGYIAQADGKVSAPIAPIEAAIDFEPIETTAEVGAPEMAVIKRGRRR